VATGPPAAIYKDEEAGSALTDWDPKVGEVDRVTLRTWVEAYEQAWRTSGTEGLDTLFAEDATYQTAPFEDPFRGLAAISTMWEEERSDPDEAFALRSEVVAVEGDTGVVRVEVHYGEPASQTYRNLWVVRLNDEGRCTTFEEWPFWPPGSEGEFAKGPPEYGDR
jgi:ketosteroid isomerase-like protein